MEFQYDVMPIIFKLKDSLLLIWATMYACKDISPTFPAQYFNKINGKSRMIICISSKSLNTEGYVIIVNAKEDVCWDHRR